MNHAVRNWMRPTTIVVFFSAFKPATKVPTPAERVVSHARFQKHLPASSKCNYDPAQTLASWCGSGEGWGITRQEDVGEEEPDTPVLVLHGRHIGGGDLRPHLHASTRVNHTMCPLCAGV